MSEAVEQVPHPVPEELHAKPANYRELFRINQGLGNAIKGLNALNAAGLIRGEFRRALVIEYVDRVHELQAVINRSATLSLTTVEERDTARLIRRRLALEQRAREQDRAQMIAISSPGAASGADRFMGDAERESRPVCKPVEQTVPHPVPEELDAKPANYRALFRINRGFGNAIEGVKALIAGGLIRGELGRELVIRYLDHLRELQAVISQSVTLSLTTVEERDAARLIRVRLDREQRAREEDEAEVVPITNCIAAEGDEDSVLGGAEGAVVKQ
jgi:hypothetical protein